ncbi:aldo/keto reductase [Streptomyces arboris]|uniref:aldo/keto reductase n=1 Tax=Streptomyces arboris TaxID=2600619 RepID=UPI003634C496
MLPAPTPPYLAGHLTHRRSGHSGLHLPPLGLGIRPSPGCACCGTPPHSLIEHAISWGVTHFDITPPLLLDPEDALRQTLSPARSRRAEVTISTRIGLGAPPAPLQGFGSRKHILSTLDSILHRTGLDYLDILYAHRYDHNTPLEETAGALASAVQQGKALYAGLSSYAPSALPHASRLLKEAGIPTAAYQTSYSLLDRWAEDSLLETLRQLGIGGIACAPLAHATLTPARLTAPFAHFSPLHTLTEIADTRAQTLPQLALSWTLRTPNIASALLTTNCLRHLSENLAALDHTDFTPEELTALNKCCPRKGPAQ